MTERQGYLLPCVEPGYDATIGEAEVFIRALRARGCRGAPIGCGPDDEDIANELERLVTRNRELQYRPARGRRR